jgi:hypothetical protein
MRHAILLLVAASLAGSPAEAQTPETPWKGKNLQFFPADINREQLVQRMREFSFALGVRCQHCHSGGDGISFEGVDFASDEKPAKVKARAMLRMVDQLNTTILAQVPNRTTPRVEVGCVTCHRGLALPKTLQTTLFEIVGRDGAAAAVERYRQLRRDQMGSGRYDFGEWEINELARRLTEAGDTQGAIAILEMNGEFHPKSASIDFGLGELHRQRGERDKAIARYEAAIAKQPTFPAAIARLKELRGK